MSNENKDVLNPLVSIIQIIENSITNLSKMVQEYTEYIGKTDLKDNEIKIKLDEIHRTLNTITASLDNIKNITFKMDDNLIKSLIDRIEHEIKNVSDKCVSESLCPKHDSIRKIEDIYRKNEDELKKEHDKVIDRLESDIEKISKSNKQKMKIIIGMGIITFSTIIVFSLLSVYTAYQGKEGLKSWEHTVLPILKKNIEVINKK